MSQALSKSDRQDDLAVYMKEAKRFKLLTREEEHDLAVQLQEFNDVDAAHKLITANLRFVVKIAMEYRSYGMRTLDLVQEGNVGLMHAVRKFDPSRGYRLITYAVWWIRAYIQSYLLRAWSMVKMGTTQAQRRLFFKLPAARAELERRTDDDVLLSPDERNAALADLIGVKASEVSSMEMRTAARDFSLDMTLEDSGDTSHLDLLTDDSADQEAMVLASEVRTGLSEEIQAALTTLNSREREVIERRYLADDKPTLREIGSDWGVSRERARQIEAVARKKLQEYLLDNSRVLDAVLPSVIPEGRGPMAAMAS